MLLNHSGIDVNILDNQNQTALIYAIQASNKKNITQQTLEIYQALIKKILELGATVSSIKKALTLAKSSTIEQLLQNALQRQADAL